MGANSDMLKQFKKSIKNGGHISKDHRDYILCKEVYHCTPTELYKQDEFTLQLHFDFYMIEKEEEFLNIKRAEMRASNRKKQS